MARDEVRAALAQAAIALGVVAEQPGHPTGGPREAGDPLAALYLAVHHRSLALERLAADEPTGA